MDAFVGTDSAIGGPNSQDSDSLERPERRTSMADELASSKVESELKDEHDIDVLELGGVVESLSRISVHAQDSLPASPLRSRSHSFSDSGRENGRRGSASRSSRICSASARKPACALHRLRPSSLSGSRKMRGAMRFHQGDTAAGCRVVLLQIAYWRRELGQVKYAQQEKIAEDGEHLRP